jgi:hypothetical protein
VTPSTATDLNRSVSAWYFGFIVTFTIILIVVALVATIIQLARRIGVQAGDIAEVLDECRANTAAMPRVRDINADTERINDGLGAVHTAMTT